MFIIPYGIGCSDEEDSRMKRGNSKESSASPLARRGKRYYANDIKDTYPCLYTVVLPVIRVTGWRSGRRGEFSTADKCDIAAAPRGEEEEIYIPFLFSREVAWTTRTERRISGQIERIPAPPPPPGIYPLSNLQLWRARFQRENFRSWRKASITAKVGGKIPRRMKPTPRENKHKKIHISRGNIFFYRYVFATKINWNNICRGFS